ncbi:hypothetical protein D6855_05380 [Butyrivibrio sp. CB08]|uniref:hypothetical protein n=1 Tax=Butyrivibrio sp. CB08 TaxID=2364879 RepID=UPI000EA9C46C|nr:hypothetical protein [Butyrivibrio sp. CB08]RKM61323.1 hypothetical protein D6855_05380 [Butyrivibrio sp. CB08]
MDDKKKTENLASLSENDLTTVSGGISNAKVDMYNSVIDGITESVDSNKAVKTITSAGAEGIKSVLNSLRD